MPNAAVVTRVSLNCIQESTEKYFCNEIIWAPEQIHGACLPLQNSLLPNLYEIHVYLLLAIVLQNREDATLQLSTGNKMRGKNFEIFIA